MSFVALILPSFVQHDADAASGKHTSTTRHAAATEPKYDIYLLPSNEPTNDVIDRRQSCDADAWLQLQYVRPGRPHK